MAKEAAMDELLAEVLSRYDNSPNPRLKEVTCAAIKHLHAFAREVNLTREEWFAGIMFLTQCGKISDDVRQEFILLSDTTGVSTLVEMLAYDASASSLTDNTVLGPFHADGSPERGFGEAMVLHPDDGDRAVARGASTDGDGKPDEAVRLRCRDNARNM